MSNSDNEETRFQIIGEKGAARLENAVKVLENLQIAKQMREAEKDAKTIWLATGWEFDPQEKAGKGAWTTETPDNEARIISSIADYSNALRESGRASLKVPLKSLITNWETFNAYPS